MTSMMFAPAAPDDRSTVRSPFDQAAARSFSKPS